ncbi:hypothetical protein [Paracoccus aminophilus]|uniref:Transmembrane protein n=1 Tax=Paracoccus aminophilus JCM 7686 TaxID=1367847 RepID=S5XV45_PARAH|nr:hypothetical protein [Paracoccus aminophilus]AGT11394.1 hypothetical protein JCM7686_pAMI6p064 [Paracoccus aminophilus JCM 7686]
MGQSLARRSFSHVAVAFLAMGSWAAFANRAHPMPEPVLAGLVQGALSGTITLGLKRMIEAVSARILGVGALIWPPVIALSASALILTSLHRLAGTPEIAATIALPLSVTTLYSTIYSYALWRSRP